MFLAALVGCDTEVVAPHDRGDEAATGKAVSAYTSTYYDFILNAPGAAWSNNDGSVPWGTNEEYGRGSCLTTTATLEDGVSRAHLFTRPKYNVANAFMRGAYSVTVPAASLHPNFTATFGFVSGASLWPATDGVTFKLTTLVGGNSVTLFSQYKNWTGALSTATVDLSAYAGQTIQVFLTADGGPTTTKDYAAWTEARIVTDNGAPAPATFYDFISSAPGAAWSNNSGSVPWGTNEEYGRGSCLTATATLEDGVSRPHLFTQPKYNVANAFMRGAYTVTIPPASVNPIMTATFGFLSGASLWPGTDGVTFKLTTLVGGNPVTLFSQYKGYTGGLMTVTANLSAYAGQTIQLFLTADGGANGTKDYAVWTDARIITNPTTHYDFITNAPAASWSNNDGGLPWLTNDTRGACYTTISVVEDGVSRLNLFTQPKNNVANGFIRGAYTVTIPSASLHPNFTATFGFKTGANSSPGTDGVTFKLTTLINGNWVNLFSQSKGWTGALTTATVDVSAYAGQTMQLLLVTDGGANSTKDWAVWTDARITVDDVSAPSTGCIISGVPWANGVVNPEVACQVCNPVNSTTAWSVRADTCLIGGQCYAPDAPDPGGCNRCDPATSPTSWTPKSSCNSPGTVTVENYDGTALGTLQSKSHGNTFAYLGVPYAAPPTGNLRLAPPAKATTWSGVRNAFNQPPPCAQPPLLPLGGMIGSEDCLYLNVWAPKTATPTSNLPVFVFHHGGAHTFGGTVSSDDFLAPGLLDGDRFADAQNAVVVTIQTRLGPLGYLTDAALAANSTSRTSNVGGGTSGNYGLLDNIQALKWVKRNISKFGGDPTKVLFSGESSGATMVCDLLASPLAKDPADNQPYFSSVIMSSGFCEQPSVAYRQSQATPAISSIGCGGAGDKVACLRGASLQSFVNLEGTILGLFPDLFGNPSPPEATFGLKWGPHIDGYVLTQQPRVSFAAGTHNKVPVIVGTNKDEGNFFTLFMVGGILTGDLPNLIVVATCGIRDIKVRTNLGTTLGNAAIALYPCNNWLPPIIAPTLSYGAGITHLQYECPARRTARALTLGQTQPVRRYWFTHGADHPGIMQNILGLIPQIGAAHAFDLPFVFNTHGTVLWYWPSTRERNLTTAVQSYWRSFANSGSTGNPNYAGSVNWTQYSIASDNALKLEVTGKTGSSDPGLEMVNGINTDKCDFWDNNFTLDGWK